MKDGDGGGAEARGCPGHSQLRSAGPAAIPTGNFWDALSGTLPVLPYWSDWSQTRLYWDGTGLRAGRGDAGLWVFFSKVFHPRSSPPKPPFCVTCSSRDPKCAKIRLQAGGSQPCRERLPGTARGGTQGFSAPFCSRDLEGLFLPQGCD